MFRHWRTKKLISAYLDAELNDKEKIFVESHLKECGGCRKYFQQLQKVSFALSQYKSEEITPDLEQRIKTNFLGNKYKEVAKMSKKRLLVGASSGALAILLIFVLVGSMQNYLKRSMQTRIHQAADELRNGTAQYEPSTGMQGRLQRTVDEISPDQYSPGTPWITTHEESRAYGSRSSKATGRSVASISDGRIKSLESEKFTGASQESISRENEGPIIIVEPYLPATGKEEKLIRNAQMSLEVNDTQKAYDEVVKIGKDKNGYLAEAYFNEQKTGKIGARIVLRVPKEKFDETIVEIKKLGAVKMFGIQSVDISQDYNALVSELNTIKVVYDKVAGKLKEKKTDIEKAINLESQLTPIAKRIADIRDKIAKYDNLIAMSTITIDLSTTSWKLLFAEHLKEAKQRLVELVSGLISATIEFLPAILVVVVAGIFGLVAVLVIVHFVKKALRKKTS